MLFSSLLPSHPDLLPILQNIRNKYGIPEIDPDDIGMKEILLSDNDIDWLSVRQEIEAQVRKKPLIKSIANNFWHGVRRKSYR
jgi:hypothetical protein